METERKTLTQLSVPICLETLFYMLSGMVDTLMLSSVSDQAVGAVGMVLRWKSGKWKSKGLVEV